MSLNNMRFSVSAMIIRSMDVRDSLGEVLERFLGLLDEIDFKVIHREETGDGFRVIGASAKRRSQLTATMMSLLIGYIQRNRITVELEARQNSGVVHAVLRSCPYLDVLDMEAPGGNPEEQERCLLLTDFIQEEIMKHEQVG